MPQLSLEDLERFAQGQPVPVRETPAISAAESRGRSYQAPQQWRQQLALDDLEDRENLPRGLLTAVLTRESNGYPTARSKAGAQGLFQFMPATAQAYKIDPTNPAQAADAAAKELGSHYKRYGGNLQQTLAAWNWGSGNLQQQGMAHAPKETRNFITWVTGLLTPASAEAATGPAQRLTLDALEQRFGAQQPAGGTTTPAPVSQAATTPAPAGGAAGGTPAPAGDTATPQEAQATLARLRTRQATEGTPEARLQRFQQLPAITALSPEERQAAVAEFQAMNEAQQRAFLASEPAADLPTAIQEGPRPTPEQQLRPQIRPSAGEPALEEGITTPSTMIPLLMPGAGIKTLPEAIRQGTGIVARAARPIVEGLSQTLGWGTGRTLETGQVPSPAELGKEAAWNIGTSAVPEVVGAVRDAWGGLLRTMPGGQRLLNQQAVKEAEGLGQRVFQSEDKAAVSQMFDDVAASRVKLDVSPLQTYWKSLIPEERRLAVRELNSISPAFAQALANPRFKGWDIGDLQHLRSELIKAYNGRKTPAVQDLLMDMRSKVDDAIAAGKAVGSVPIGTNAETLQQAQAAWHKVKQAENLQALVTKHTHRSGRELRSAELNLSALDKDLRGGGTRAAQRLVGQMNEAEKAALQAEMKTLSRKYPFLHISDTGAKMTEWGSLISATTNLAMGNVPASLASVLGFLVTASARSPRVMRLLSNSIVESRGRLTPDQVDTILTAIRHEQEGPSGTAP